MIRLSDDKLRTTPTTCLNLIFYAIFNFLLLRKFISSGSKYFCWIDNEYLFTIFLRPTNLKWSNLEINLIWSMLEFNKILFLFRNLQFELEFIKYCVSVSRPSLLGNADDAPFLRSADRRSLDYRTDKALFNCEIFLYDLWTFFLVSISREKDVTLILIYFLFI